ncbi:MAG: hypothetical protein QOF89_4208 [Acidobacteriota bacterium]|jgi:cysteine synthase A|nr:hypothetical protein [Acidobacteriota bacterium]
MTVEHFAFLESNTTGTGALAVQRLLARGARVTFLTRSPEKYPFLASRPSSLSVVEMDTNVVEQVAEGLARVMEQEGIDALLTFSEFYVVIAAEVAALLGLRYLSPAAARICRNKPETRRVLRASGLAVPESRLVLSEDEARRVADEMPYPCVVKPPADSSSRGVRLVRDGRELLEHFAILHAWRQNGRGQTLRGEVLIESLLAGPEVSVETLTLAPGETRVVGITAKHLSPPPLFVEIGHDFPSNLDAATSARLEREVLAALDAVGFDFGPAHTEVRLTAAGPVVVEINARLAGGMIPELVRHARGIDLLEALLEQVLGKPFDLAPKRAEWASIRFLLAGRRGRLGATSGVEQALRLPSIREVWVGKPAGAAVRPAEEAADRLGYVIASGPSREQVLADIEEALERIHLAIDQD